MTTRIRLAEVVAILAMATDLGLGLPVEHSIRTCLLSVAMGRRLGMSSGELGDLYYLTLLRMLDCTAGSAESAAFFGDEVAFGRDTQHLDYGDAAGFGQWVMNSFGLDKPPDERRRMIETLFSYTPRRRALFTSLVTRTGLATANWASGITPFGQRRIA